MPAYAPVAAFGKERLQHVNMLSPIRTMFNQIAPTYDLLNHMFTLNIDRWWRRKALHAIMLPATARILDVCTGTADVALAIARHYPEAHIYGVDFSEVMLRRGHVKILRHNYKNRITLLHADALALPFSTSTFDAVFLSFGLRNLAERQTGICDIYRVLQPGGHLVILEFAPPPKTLFGQMFHWYVGRVMPVLGGVVSRSPSAYRYLHSSIQQFPEPPAITKLLQNAHFHHIHDYDLMGRAVYLYIGQK
jgi:demethylmenaquinone methyltransferase/2-methoxy-6-polyprenyl-1,4-benzoquinol methylase